MTAEEVREAIRAMLADDHSEGCHDLTKVEGCLACDAKRGRFESRAVSVCRLPMATTIVTRRHWVEATS
jgi:hypothetical protein